MSDITTQTLDAIKAVYAGDAELRKAASNTVNIASGLLAFDLQAPAKQLYPVNTPLVAATPRAGGGTGSATNWRQITAITGSGYDSMGWVPEGVRAGAMSLTTATKAASYTTIGEEEQVTFEAQSGAQGFEDILSTSAIRLLQKMRQKEENAILGGNASLALGTTPTATSSASGSGATLPTLTYDLGVVAMTYEGYRNWLANGASIVTGLTQTRTINSQDGSTFNLNGGYAQKSAVATQAVTIGQTLFVAVAPVTGAYAYAWYIGGAGASRLEKVTPLATTTFTAALAGTGQTFASLTASDVSRNTSAFDGFLSNVAQGLGGYYVALANGVTGVGTPLTTSGRGSVTEIDTMFQTMWDNFQVSPTVLYVNSKELKTITNLVLGNTSSAPLVRFNNDGSGGRLEVQGGGVVRSYFNPFSTNGGYEIPVRVHPFLPPGTIFGYCEKLPEFYQSSNVPNTAEVKTRRDYYQIMWPLVTRAYQTGVYSEEVLAIYAPFALGVITNIQ